MALAPYFPSADLVYDQLRRTCSLASVLDVGCGSGHLVRKLLENGSDAYGVDLARDAAQHAADWAACRFVQAEAGGLPFSDEAFDTVVATHLLDWLSPDALKDVLEELRRVCGRFLFVIVSTTPPGSVHSRRTAQPRDAWDRLLLPHGFCRHPLIQTIVPFAETATDHENTVLIYEKLSAAALERYPIAAFALERDTRMDMLREAGVRSDAHIARYHLASGYVRPGDVVVDVACGLGYGSAIIADGSLASRVIGMDDSAYAVDYATTVFGSRRPQVEFQRGDVLDLRQCGTGSVDVIVSFDTLEYVPDPQKFLAEVARVLTPGGRFIGSVPNLYVDETDVYDSASLVQQCRAQQLLIEQLYQQNAERRDFTRHEPAALFEIDEESTRLQGKPEWILIVAAKNPAAGKSHKYRETIYTEGGNKPPRLTDYAGDYKNPWLVRSMVNISSRFRSPELLLSIAAEVQKAEAAQSADMGAALCVEGYQLTRYTTTPRAAIDSFMVRASSYVKKPAKSAHAYRWQLSLQFLIGKIHLLVGDRKRAKTTFKALSEQDVLSFSPLLGTKTIGAAFIAGWLCALDGETKSAKTLWARGVTETRRLLQGDWHEIWGDPSNPLPFALPEISDIADAGSHCAIALKYAARLHRQPGLFWRLMEDYSKGMQSESARLRAFAHSILDERTKTETHRINAEHQRARRDLERTQRELLLALEILRVSKAGRPFLIWGAGSSGRQLMAGLNACGIRPAGFIDSDPPKTGTAVAGLNVMPPDIVSSFAQAAPRPFVVIGSMYGDQIRPLLVQAGLREMEDFCDPLPTMTVDELTALLGAQPAPEAKSVPVPALSNRSRAPRCLMFYPWNLNESIGALRLFLSYSKALKNAGYRLDCYAPRATKDLMIDGLYHGIFENVFVMPEHDAPLTRHLEYLGKVCEDPLLPDKAGRDEPSMVAAGILVSISDYDVVGIQYTRCHSLKQMLPPGMPVVVFTHDLDALVSRQEELIFGFPAEYKLTDEAARLKPFNLVTVVGPDDRRALESIDPGLPIVEATFTSPVAESTPVHEDSPGVLLCISCAGPFHSLSFLWFWKNVWPKVRAARPECRLIIAGRLSDVALQAGAGDDPQVSVLGVVDDIEPLYRQADVVVAPYYYGLGIKTKVIEALAHGIPVATTSLGIYNTQIEPGREAIVANDAAEYASEIVKLISCPALRAELGENGREYIRKWHDPQTALAAFVEAFDRARLAKPAAAKSRATTLRDLHEPLRYLIPWTLARCHDDDIRRVAIYGAGSHTRILIPVWKALGGPAIDAILVTGQPAEPDLMGYPVVSVDEFQPDGVDGIVMSSHGYEHEMARLCAARWPQLKTYLVWRPIMQLDSTAGQRSATMLQEAIPADLYKH